MKYSKRILALLLALALCFGTAPFSMPVMAESYEHGGVYSEDDLPEAGSPPAGGEVVSQPEEEEIPIQEAASVESAVEENASPEGTEEEPTLAQLLETEGAEISVTRDRAAAASTGKRMLKAAAVGQSGTLRVGYNSYSNNVGYLESIKSREPNSIFSPPRTFPPRTAV